jgi:hypothetical protein
LQRNNVFNKIKKFIVSIFKEEPALTKLKEDMMLACDIPESLTCPILQDIPDDLVVTPYGHVFSFEKLQQWLKVHGECPLTRKPLDIHQTKVDAQLHQIAAQVKVRFAKVITAINNMSLEDKDKILALIEPYNEFAKLAEVEAANRLQVIIQAALINELIEKLKLNIDNPEHLHYWQQRSSRVYDVCTMVLGPDGSEYNISTNISDLMQLSNKQYESKADYKRALDSRIEVGLDLPSICPHPFKFFVATTIRNPAGSEIYAAQDVDKAELRPLR